MRPYLLLTTERDDLDRIWNEHMLDRRAALIVLDKGSESTTEGGPLAAWDGIIVRRVGKGIWTNGGWVLQGGLLDSVVVGSATYDLFGKKVIRRIPYFPFPFHRDPPKESGFEFFLLRRVQTDARASVVRHWVFLPADVQLSEHGSTDISAIMTREPGSQTVVITVRGLKRPFVERIDLAAQ